MPQLVREFDGPNPSFPISVRNRSTVSTQALAMMNDPWVRSRADATVTSLGSNSEYPAIFRNILGRNPYPEEARWAEEVVEQAGLTELAHQLFASIDFRYVP